MVDPGRFEILRSIGKGAFATVYMCRDKEQASTVAVKKVRLDACKDRIETFQKEVTLMGQCRNPFIVGYIGSHIWQSEIWIVMEYLPAGSVLRLMRKLRTAIPEAACAVIFHDVLEGLAYLHSYGHVHMDIKPGNILLTLEGRSKLCDLGVAVGLPPGQLAEGGDAAKQAKPSKMAGTLLYMSPEMVTQAPVSCNTDIWSLGITAIEMATGRLPRGDVHQMKAIYMTAHHPPPVLEGKFASAQKEFVALCLVKDPKERKQASALLTHKFVKGQKKSSKLIALVKKSLEGKATPEGSDEEGSDDDRDTRYDSEEEWDFGT